MLKQQLKSSKLNPTKAQSAMEYLMTYGWAIVIIAVVLTIIYSLNVFNPTPPTACIGVPGYSCSNPLISSAGVLSFTLGLAPGAAVYNVLFSCVAPTNVNPSTITYNPIAANDMGQTAVTSPTTASAYNSIIGGAGTTVSISKIQCYSSGSTPAILPSIGTSFSGAIWMAYTSAGTGGLNYVKIATFSAKASS